MRFKKKIKSLRTKFFLLSWWNYDFKYSMDAELSLEEEESKD